MKTSAYKNYNDLPLFLNARMVSQVLGVSPSSGYELMHTPGFEMYYIELATGLRRGELLGLKWEDIDAASLSVIAFCGELSKCSSRQVFSNVCACSKPVKIGHIALEITRRSHLVLLVGNIKITFLLAIGRGPWYTIGIRTPSWSWFWVPCIVLWSALMQGAFLMPSRTGGRWSAS